MGTCYSKSGQQVDPDEEKRPKKKNSYKNGHMTSSKHLTIIVEDYDSVQKDVSDTVYTEDSHFLHGTEIENCINKSQQTSLLNLDANKNFESDNGSSENNVNKSAVTLNSKTDKPKLGPEEECLLVGDGECRAGSLNDGINNEERLEDVVDVIDTDTELEEVFDDKNEPNTNTSVHIGQGESVIQNKTCERLNQCAKSKIDRTNNSEHSGMNGTHENEKRESVSSMDQLSESLKLTDSNADLDKIELAFRQASNGSFTENRSLVDDFEASFDLSSLNLPTSEVVTMTTINGRDIVVMDAEMFASILESINQLKNKLGRLTQVIQDDTSSQCFSDSEIS